MRYRKPFDLAQRQKAIARFRSFHHNYRVLRKLYSPATRQQKAILREYRQLLGAFRDALIQPDAYVAVDALNDLDTKLAAVFIQYMTEKLSLRGTDENQS